MNKKSVTSFFVFAAMLLAGCNDSRTAEQQTFEKDVLEAANAIRASGDMTRKSAEAAKAAEQMLRGMNGKKIEKWVCIQTGGACTSNKKKVDYQISLYPDRYIRIDAYEGDKISFAGAVTRIDTRFGDATVWVVVNSEADIKVTPK